MEYKPRIYNLKTLKVVKMLLTRSFNWVNNDEKNFLQNKKPSQKRRESFCVVRLISASPTVFAMKILRQLSFRVGQNPKERHQNGRQPPWLLLSR